MIQPRPMLGFHPTLLALVLVSGCATLLRQQTLEVPVTSEPPGALVRVDGSPVGRTPTAVTLDNDRTHRVTVVLGKRAAELILVPQVGVGWILADILMGPISLTVDAITGNWREHEGAPLVFDLKAGRLN